MEAAEEFVEKISPDVADEEDGAEKQPLTMEERRAKMDELRKKMVRKRFSNPHCC